MRASGGGTSEQGESVGRESQENRRGRARKPGRKYSPAELFVALIGVGFLIFVLAVLISLVLG
jgi:hypothetical protein